MLDKHHSLSIITESLDQSVCRVWVLTKKIFLLWVNVMVPHLGEHHQDYDVVAHWKYSPHNSQWSKFSHRLQWLSGCCDVHGEVWSVSWPADNWQPSAVSYYQSGDSTQVNSVAHWSLPACYSPTVVRTNHRKYHLHANQLTGKQENYPPLPPSLLPNLCENSKLERRWWLLANNQNNAKIEIFYCY